MIEDKEKQCWALAFHFVQLWREGKGLGVGFLGFLVTWQLLDQLREFFWIKLGITWKEKDNIPGIFFLQLCRFVLKFKVFSQTCRLYTVRASHYKYLVYFQSDTNYIIFVFILKMPQLSLATNMSFLLCLQNDIFSWRQHCRFFNNSHAPSLS